MARTVREELKAAFEAKQRNEGLTYQRLGELLGIDKASAFRKINGKTGIDSGTELELFARVLGVKFQVKGDAA